MLIKQKDWYKLYKHDIDLKSITQDVHNFMKSNEGHKVDEGLIAGQTFWIYINESLTAAVNAARPVIPLTSPEWEGGIDNGCTIWEMSNGVTLQPHIDSSRYTSFVILPLVGRTTTSMHGQLPDNMINDSSKPTMFPEDTLIVDSITYGPGEFIVINNTKYIHSVTLIDDYRLVLQFNAESF